MTNKYAMATITHGRRFYWSKTINGWSVWHDASHYTEDERKKAKLPRNAFWVSVLRGMGANPYPADGVLNDPPAEYLARLPKPKVQYRSAAGADPAQAGRCHPHPEGHRWHA